MDGYTMETITSVANACTGIILAISAGCTASIVILFLSCLLRRDDTFNKFIEDNND